MIDKLARRKIFSGQTVTRGIQKEFAEHKEDAHALVKGRIDFFVPAILEEHITYPLNSDSSVRTSGR